MNQRGFTLVELLVAMVLFVMLGAGGLAAWTRGNAAWREASIEQVLHERAQYVFATLEPQLQMAGYFGQSAPAAPLAADSIPLAAQDCGLGLIQRIDQPIETTAGYALPCAARGGGAAAASQLLIIRRASAQLATAANGRAQWLSNAAGGQLVWNELGAVSAPAGAERRDLLLRVYYVALAADGDATTPALRMQSLTSVAGRPAFIDTEVMPGVEALQTQLLPDAQAPRAARLTLTLRTDQADARRGQVRRLTLTREFALRNAAAR
jgi:prepilin-type N-terminal cleavage/methylation domain-containing protein